MSNFEKISLWILLVIVLSTNFFIVYTRMNDNYKIEVVERKIKKQEIEIEKLQYVIEHNSKKDTFIVNINNFKK